MYIFRFSNKIDDFCSKNNKKDNIKDQPDKSIQNTHFQDAAKHQTL